MDITSTILKIAVACAGVYFLYGVFKLIITILRPATRASVSPDPIPTDFGLLTFNPSDREDNWILQQSELPIDVRILGDPPETALLKFLDPILKYTEFISREIETAGFSTQECELHLLYVRKDTCYFDIVVPSGAIQMGFSDTKGVYRL